MKKLVFLFLAYLLMPAISGQGCSDAGGCSVGSLALLHEGDGSQPALGMQYSQSIGLADKYSVVSLTSVTISHHLTKSTDFEITVPFQATFGNLGNTSGVGDLFISASHTLLRRETTHLSATAAGRFKSNDADKSLDNNPLPMVYQTSLGTNDLIAGLNLSGKKWRISLAYQHPFGANKNMYLLPEEENTPENKRYFESAGLKRGNDLAVRIGRNDKGGEKSSFSYGTLVVYRLQPDQIKRNNQYETLHGSDGAVVNLFFAWFRELDAGRRFFISGAFPPIARKYRADGLTRTFLIQAGLSFSFYTPGNPVSPASNPLFEMLEHRE